MSEYIKAIELTDAELEAIAGGKHKKSPTYIEGDDGKSYVHTGPGLHYKRIGILHVGEDAKFLGNTSVDERGVLWYMINWKGREAWVSSRYTVQVVYD